MCHLSQVFCFFLLKGPEVKTTDHEEEKNTCSLKDDIVSTAGTRGRVSSDQYFNMTSLFCTIWSPFQLGIG